MGEKGTDFQIEYECRFFLISKGYAMLKTERAERMLNLYDIAVIPPHVPYRFAAAAAAEFLTVCVPGEQLSAETARLLPAGHPLTLLFSGSARAQAVFHWLPAPEEVQTAGVPELQRFLCMLADAAADTGGTVLLYRQALLTLTIQWIIRHYPVCQSFPAGGGASSVMTELMRYLQMQYQSASLQSAAVYLNRSAAYLSRLVKRHTGKNFSAILYDFRLHRARMLLTHPEMTETEIAAAVGFKSLRYFRTAFQKEFLLTPRQYRKQQAGMEGLL